MPAQSPSGFYRGVLGRYGARAETQVIDALLIAAQRSPTISPGPLFPGQLPPIGSNMFAVFGKPGTYTWTVPSGVTQIRVRVWGAGGSAGVSNASGGGGGGFCMKTLTVTPGTTYSITVGQGGQGCTVSGVNSTGFAGGASSFGAVLTATGGGAGSGSNGGTLTGGAGGVGSGGDVNYTGGVGGSALGGGACSAGGGGAATQLGPGGQGGNALAAGGTGGGGAGGAAGGNLSVGGQTGGGGVSGSAPDNSIKGGLNSLGQRVLTGVDAIFNPIPNAYGRFIGDILSGGGGDGGGGAGGLGGGAGGTALGTGSSFGNGGPFGGGGGASGPATSGGTYGGNTILNGYVPGTVGNGGVAAGSGAVPIFNVNIGGFSTGVAPYGSNAGNGLVVVEW